MSTRKIEAVTVGDVVVNVYRDSEHNDYQCRIAFPVNERNPDATYFTECRMDAIDTARDMARRIAARRAGAAI